MKPKLKFTPIEIVEHLHTKSISYRWSLPDGTICHGSSVVLSRSRAGLHAALRRFWLTHTHISPESL